MQGLKIIYYAVLSSYAWIVNDEKRMEELKEHILVSRVSMKVRHYRTHFFNQ